jgi:hypothetical protein
MDSTMREGAGDGLTQAPTGRLVRDFFEEAKHVAAEGTRLLRAEVETAKREIAREAKKAGPAAAMTGAASVLGHAAVLMFAVTLATALSLALPMWAGFAITGVVLAVAGAVVFSQARNKLRSIDLKPDVAIHNLQEDQRWAKGLTQDVRSNLRHDT